MAKQAERELVRLALTDLSRSGLDQTAYRKMAIRPLSAAAVSRLTKKFAVPAYEIPYFELDGKKNCFSRLRFLSPARSFGAKKDQRYWQEAGSPTRVYLPPFTDWQRVAADTDVEVYITEGEKKAAAATLAGLPTIGLGGVWSWMSKKRAEPLLPDLELFSWKKRSVVLVFDTDPEPKPEVTAALNQLARELERRGASITTVSLPTQPGKKVGLDDFLVDRGVEAFSNLPRQPVGLGVELVRFNEEVAYITDLAAVYVPATDHIFASRQQFSTIAYANREVTVINAKGDKRSVSVADEWLRWPHRRTYRCLTYAPGQPRVLADGAYNLWRGWGCEPREGELAPYFELMDYLFTDQQPEHRRWFEQWLAYPVQHPGAKLYSAVVLWSTFQGVGKTLLGKTIGKVYGDNFSTVITAQLHSPFNSWQCHKQFILGEEVTGSDKRHDADVLKHIITGDSISINQKYRPAYDLPNLANYMFTTNHPDAFLLDPADRRYFILEIAREPPAAEFFSAYDVWLRHADAPAAVFYHLLNRVDTTDFNPRGLAPTTDAKRDMIDLSGGEADRIARELRDSPDALLTFGGKQIDRDLFTASELLTILGVDSKLISVIAFSRALTRAGFRKLPTTRVSAKLVVGPRWVVRNLVSWHSLDTAERVKAYTDLYLQKKETRF